MSDKLLCTGGASPAALDVVVIGLCPHSILLRLLNERTVMLSSRIVGLLLQSGKHSRGGGDHTDAPGVKRSIITGEVIKMKIDKTADDRARERGRAELLAFMNSQY